MPSAVYRGRKVGVAVEHFFDECDRDIAERSCAAFGNGMHKPPYMKLWHGGKLVRLHRLIAERAGMGVGNVDHINGNTLDNRRSNLRACSQRVNARNSVARGFRQDGGKFFARIGVATDVLPESSAELQSQVRELQSKFPGKKLSRLIRGEKVCFLANVYGKARDTAEEARSDYEELKRIYHAGVIGRRAR